MTVHRRRLAEEVHCRPDPRRVHAQRQPRRHRLPARRHCPESVFATHRGRPYDTRPLRQVCCHHRTHEFARLVVGDVAEILDVPDCGRKHCRAQPARRLGHCRRAQRERGGSREDNGRARQRSPRGHADDPVGAAALNRKLVGNERSSSAVELPEPDDEDAVFACVEPASPPREKKRYNAAHFF